MLERIKMLCKKKGVSLQEASDACKFGQKSIYTWGKNLPASIERVKRLADYFGVTVDYLLRGGDDRESKVIADRISEKGDEIIG